MQLALAARWSAASSISVSSSGATVTVMGSASQVAAPATGTCSFDTTCQPSQAIPATIAVITTITRLRTPAPAREARA